MENNEKILLFKQLSGDKILSTEQFYEVLEKCDSLKTNYFDYMTTSPINCDVELLRLNSANYDLSCALLTMLLREDHFCNGSFGKRQHNGQVQPIIEHIIALLTLTEKPKKTTCCENTKQAVFFEASLKLKNCHRNHCNGSLNTSEMFLWRNPNSKRRYSCKKCELCGTIYLDCELYNTIKNKEQLEILNPDINEIMQAIKARKEKTQRKKRRELNAACHSGTLESKRYIGNSLEKSFIKIDIENLKKK